MRSQTLTALLGLGLLGLWAATSVAGPIEPDEVAVWGRTNPYQRPGETEYSPGIYALGSTITVKNKFFQVLQYGGLAYDEDDHGKESRLALADFLSINEIGGQRIQVWGTLEYRKIKSASAMSEGDVSPQIAYVIKPKRFKLAEKRELFLLPSEVGGVFESQNRTVRVSLIPVDHPKYGKVFHIEGLSQALRQVPQTDNCDTLYSASEATYEFRLERMSLALPRSNLKSRVDENRRSLSGNFWLNCRVTKHVSDEPYKYGYLVDLKLVKQNSSSIPNNQLSMRMTISSTISSEKVIFDFNQVASR